MLPRSKPYRYNRRDEHERAKPAAHNTRAPQHKQYFPDRWEYERASRYPLGAFS